MVATPFLQHSSWLLLHFYSTVHVCYSISTAQFMFATPFLQHSSWLLLHFYSTVHGCYSISTAQFMFATQFLQHSSWLLLPCLGNPDYALENSTIDYSDSGISIRWTPFHRRVRAQQEQRYVWLFAPWAHTITHWLVFFLSEFPVDRHAQGRDESCRVVAELDVDQTELMYHASNPPVSAEWKQHLHPGLRTPEEAVNIIPAYQYHPLHADTSLARCWLWC